MQRSPKGFTHSFSAASEASTKEGDKILDDKKWATDIPLPWQSYALNWSNTTPNPRLFVGSFTQQNNNSIRAIDLSYIKNDLNYTQACTTPSSGYPASQIACQPSRRGLVDGGDELVAAATDAVRLWRAALPESDGQLAAIQAAEKGLAAPPPEMILVAELTGRRHPHRAPLTGLDWSVADPQLLVTSSVDTTCTLWDLGAAKIRTQLIAHDRPVLDVQFAASNSPDVFGSAGEDGSVRLFDLRSLDQSTIIYESSGSPLLRLRFNRVDPNYVAVLELGSPLVTLLDVRMPGVQVARLSGHTAPPAALAWNPASRNHLVTGGDDNYVFLWDLSKPTLAATEGVAGCQFLARPNCVYSLDQPIHNLTWSLKDPGYLAIGSSQHLKILGI